jgi:tetratricopeptide (TPR) repeat protein
MKSKRISLAVLALLLLAAVVYLQNSMDQRQLRSFASGESLVIFPKPSILRAASLGHANLAADYYWLKTIQYLGTCIILKIKPVKIYQYAEFVTDVDPGFFEAYYYPAVVMSVDQITPEQNIALLEKGRKNLPEKGEIAYLLGFAYYYSMGEREKAAKNLEDAAKLRDYAPYAILAARIRAEGNNPDLSLSFLGELTKDPKMKTWAGSVNQMILGLNQRKALDQLNQAIKQFYTTQNRDPVELNELKDKGLIPTIPQDPLGGTFYIDPQTHQAKSTKQFYSGVYKPPGWEKK